MQAISFMVACSQNIQSFPKVQPRYDIYRARRISQCLMEMLPHLKNKEWVNRKLMILSDAIKSLTQQELTTAERHEISRVIDEVWFLVEFADFERLT